MKLFLNRPEYFYEMENLCRLFFPHERFEKNPESSEPGDAVFCHFASENGKTVARCRVSYNGNVCDATEECPCPGNPREEEITMARGIFRLLCEQMGFVPRWGILTGVRPGKLYSSLFRELGSFRAAGDYMMNRLLVQEEKIELCHRVFLAEEKAKALCDPSAFSLYISIPFCPTRCSYCSFVSHSVEKTAKLVPRYVELLCKELEEIGKTVARLGLTLKTVYFGGGTPTQLSPRQLDTVMDCIEKHFDLSALLEYTVEGGRPDTVTPEKLAVLKAHGVTRISINPQTMHDRILQLIGRHHTAQQVLDALAMARSYGFDNINMDVIAGLPGDDVQGFTDTLDILLPLSPENLTVHTLSVKRSSFITARGEIADTPNAHEVTRMLAVAKEKLSAGGYAPYYLYRQSKMLGNLENIGWSQKGQDCLYNIYMMNELHTVLAAGAGGVSRLKDPRGEQIERIFNYKYPYEYIERFETVLARKRGIDDFYERYPIQ